MEAEVMWVNMLLYSRLAQEYKRVSITSVCVFINVQILLRLSTGMSIYRFWWYFGNGFYNVFCLGVLKKFKQFIRATGIAPQCLSQTKCSVPSCIHESPPVESCPRLRDSMMKESYNFRQKYKMSPLIQNYKQPLNFNQVNGLQIRFPTYFGQRKIDCTTFRIRAITLPVTSSSLTGTLNTNRLIGLRHHIVSFTCFTLPM